MMSKTLQLIAMLFALSTSTFAQNINSTAKEINEQVWKVFIKSWNKMDAETFNSVHAEDVLRAGSKKIRIGGEYFSSNKENFRSGKEKGRKREIELRFESRVARNDLAYEVGYYRITDTSDPADTKQYFGRFHVVLKKLNETWKIIQDWDSDQVGHIKITSEFFDNAKAIDADF